MTDARQVQAETAHATPSHRHAVPEEAEMRKYWKDWTLEKAEGGWNLVHEETGVKVALFEHRDDAKHVLEVLQRWEAESHDPDDERFIAEFLPSARRARGPVTVVPLCEVEAAMSDARARRLVMTRFTKFGGQLDDWASPKVRNLMWDALEMARIALREPEEMASLNPEAFAVVSTMTVQERAAADDALQAVSARLLWDCEKHVRAEQSQNTN
jgi:hypothetical protein